jgi:hypothetical protein
MEQASVSHEHLKVRILKCTVNKWKQTKLAVISLQSFTRKLPGRRVAVDYATVVFVFETCALRTKA